jgi:hypothetical protein
MSAAAACGVPVGPTGLERGQARGARACERERGCGPETGARASGDGRGGGVTAGGAAIGSRDDHRFFGQFSLLKKNVGRGEAKTATGGFRSTRVETFRDAVLGS